MKNIICKMSVKEEDHLKMIQWINYHREWENDFMIIKGEEYDRFMESDDENEIMDMVIVNGFNLYNKFKDITGVHLLNIDDFVSMEYLNENRNDIKVTLNIDNKEEKYILAV